MSLISPERQYAINYEISREAPSAPQAAPSAAAKGKKPAEPARNILLDDPVNLRQSLGLDPSKPRVSLQDFRVQVGQDSALLENTLRTKIAEYGLRPGTKLELARDERGEIQVHGANTPQGVLMQIGKDLNLNQEVRNAFSRISVNQPTLPMSASCRPHTVPATACSTACSATRPTIIPCWIWPAATKSSNSHMTRIHWPACYKPPAIQISASP